MRNIYLIDLISSYTDCSHFMLWELAKMNDIQLAKPTPKWEIYLYMDYVIKNKISITPSVETRCVLEQIKEQYKDLDIKDFINYATANKGSSES